MTATLTPIKGHYPLVTRTVLELFNEGELPNLAEIQVEPVYGFVMRLIYRSGRVRLARGYGVGVNLHGSSGLAKDKGYTKYFLQQLGYATPAGRVFVLPRRQAVLNRALGRHGAAVDLGIDELERYVGEQLSFPCYIKPNEGSMGSGVTRCASMEDVRATVAHYIERHRGTFVIEEAVPWTDYRVVVLDGEAVACYQRRPPSVVGDGRSTIRELLAAMLGALFDQGRIVNLDLDDPRIPMHLAQHGRDFETVLPAGQRMAALAISNLSAGGSAQDCTELLHPRWGELCARVCADMDLRYAGVDLACPDISDPDAPYSILELNGAPGMEHFATLGPAQLARARAIYRRLFNEVLAGA